ncbi:hypothetical protein DVW02_16140 [Clostridium botulinum]|nr:hypothetical protein [Clostridium botulinum]
MIPMLVHEINKDRDKINEFILDNTKIKEGIYLKIDIDKPFDTNNFTDYLIVDSTCTFENAKNNVYISNREELIEYFKERDYRSWILNDNANKCLDIPDKKCLSTVYLTLGLKLEKIQYSNSDKKKFKSSEDAYTHLNETVTSKYINMGQIIHDKFKLSEMKRKFNFVDKNLNDYIERANAEDRKEEILLVDNYIKNNLDNIFKFVKSQNLKKDHKMKIFFNSSSNKINDTIENYRLEEALYLAYSLINKSDVDYIDGQLKGSLSLGYNNNKKKPFSKPKFMNFEFVNYYTFQEAIDIKIAFDFMKVINDRNGAKAFGLNNITSKDQFTTDVDDLTKIFDKSLIIRLNFKDKFIEEYDLRASVEGNLNPIGLEMINCINYLNPNFEFKRKPQSKNSDNNATSTFKIMELIAFIMFTWTSSLNLYSNYQPYGVNGSADLENRCRILFSKYKYVINDILDKKDLDKKNIISLKKIIKEYIGAYIDSMNSSKNFKYGLKDIFNYKLNILNKIEKEECEEIMLLNIMKEKEVELLNKEPKFIINSDEEFYYTLGQLAFYIESQSNGDCDFGVFKFYVNNKKINLLKSYLTQQMERYSHKITLKNVRFKRVYSEAMDYTPKEDIRMFREIFYMGVCADNMLWKPNKKENKEVCVNDKN